MKAVLEFQLPEEKEDHEAAYNGWNYKAAIEEFDEWLRKLEKYENRQVVDIRTAREHLAELMKERGI